MANTKIPKKRVSAKKLPTGPHGGIELLLIQSVEHLGHQGDVVEVKPGYARITCSPRGWPPLPPSTTSG